MIDWIDCMRTPARVLAMAAIGFGAVAIICGPPIRDVRVVPQDLEVDQVSLVGLGESSRERISEGGASLVSFFEGRSLPEGTRYVQVLQPGGGRWDDLTIDISNGMLCDHENLERFRIAPGDQIWFYGEDGLPFR